MKKLFAFLFPPAPHFEPGSRVNHIEMGRIIRTDGVTLAQTSTGVVVEWATGGSSVVSPHNLCRIA